MATLGQKLKKIDKSLFNFMLVRQIYHVARNEITYYNDVIMSAMASQITSLTIGYSDKRNIKAPRRWPLLGKFAGDGWIPRTKGQ